MGHLIVSLSEVKETISFSSRFFFGIPDFYRFRGKWTIFRVPKKDIFLSTSLVDKNVTLTVYR